MSNAWIDQIKPGAWIALAEIADGAQDNAGRSLADVIDEDHNCDVPAHARVDAVAPCDDGYTDLTLTVGLIDDDGHGYLATVEVSALSAERVTILNRDVTR